MAIALAVCRPLRRRSGALHQPGLRVRRPAPAGRRRRHGRARRRRRGLVPRGRRARPAGRRVARRRTRLEHLSMAVRRPRAPSCCTGSCEEPALTGMGTTVTALLRTGGRLALAHIGDSRAYLLREGELIQVTRDHTFVQTLVDEGRLTAEEAEQHPQRSVLMRVLSDVVDDVEPDLSMREARIGDRYLLCSDGLSGVVSFDTLPDTLAAGKDPETDLRRAGPARAAQRRPGQRHLHRRRRRRRRRDPARARAVRGGRPPSSARRGRKAPASTPAERAAELTAGDGRRPGRRRRWRGAAPGEAAAVRGRVRAPGGRAGRRRVRRLPVEPGAVLRRHLRGAGGDLPRSAAGPRAGQPVPA